MFGSYTILSRDHEVLKKASDTQNNARLKILGTSKAV